MSRAEKRSRNSDDVKNQTNSRKKRRVENTSKVTSGGKRVSTGGGAIVAEHELTWKEVTLPDRLEDAEGFLGLEEIEDVEVVKEGGKDRVHFKVSMGFPVLW